jgi:hypothetical protein
VPSPHLVIAVVLGLFATLGSVAARAEDGRESAAQHGTQTVPDARAGQWIHVDPQTGQRIARPPAAAAIAANPAFSTSHRGLAEQPAPGGGTMIDLQGRFRSAATATTGADGTAHVHCIGPGAAGAER